MCWAPFKTVGHTVVQKLWAPLRKPFAPPGVPSWLRVCFSEVNLEV